MYSHEDFKAMTVAKEDKALAALQGLSKEDFVYACIMAGCEYLDNIPRVGLKVVLKHFEREKSFKKVMEFLRSNKSTSDKVPKNYEVLAAQVAQLFTY